MHPGRHRDAGEQDTGEQVAQPVGDDTLLDRRQRPEPAGRTDMTGEHRRQNRLVELDDQVGTRQDLRDLTEVAGDALREGLGDVPGGPGVLEDLVPPLQLDGGGERPGPGDGNLERSGVAGGDLTERVEVASHQVTGATQVDAGTRHQPPSGRLQVDRHVREQTRGTSDHVGAGPAAGQLRQVRQIAELVEDQPACLDRVRPRQRPDPGRRPGLPQPGADGGSS